MILWCLFAVLLLLISINDFLFFRIEDEYIITLFLFYIIFCFLGVLGQHFLESCGIAILLFATTVLMNRYGAMGGGDVKLIVPLILLAENNLMTFFTGTCISSLILSICYLLFYSRIFLVRKTIITYLFLKFKNKNSFLNILLLSFNRINKKIVAKKAFIDNAWKQEIPFGIALSGGGLYVIFENIVAR